MRYTTKSNILITKVYFDILPINYFKTKVYFVILFIQTFQNQSIFCMYYKPFYKTTRFQKQNFLHWIHGYFENIKPFPPLSKAMNLIHKILCYSQAFLCWRTIFSYMFQVLLCDDCWCMLHIGWTRALVTIKLRNNYLYLSELYKNNEFNNSIKQNYLIHGCETMILLQHSPTFPPRFVVLRGRGVTEKLVSEPMVIGN